MWPPAAYSSATVNNDNACNASASLYLSVLLFYLPLQPSSSYLLRTIASYGTLVEQQQPHPGWLACQCLSVSKERPKTRPENVKQTLPSQTPICRHTSLTLRFFGLSCSLLISNIAFGCNSANLLYHINAASKGTPVYIPSLWVPSLP